MSEEERDAWIKRGAVHVKSPSTGIYTHTHTHTHKHTNTHTNTHKHTYMNVNCIPGQRPRTLKISNPHYLIKYRSDFNESTTEIKHFVWRTFSFVRFGRLGCLSIFRNNNGKDKYRYRFLRHFFTIHRT